MRPLFALTCTTKSTSRNLTYPWGFEEENIIIGAQPHSSDGTVRCPHPTDSWTASTPPLDQFHQQTRSLSPLYLTSLAFQDLRIVLAMRSAGCIFVIMVLARLISGTPIVPGSAIKQVGGQSCTWVGTQPRRPLRASHSTLNILPLKGSSSDSRQEVSRSVLLKRLNVGTHLCGEIEDGGPGSREFILLPGIWRLSWMEVTHRPFHPSCLFFLSLSLSLYIFDELKPASFLSQEEPNC